MFIRDLISQLISAYEIDFDTFIKSRTEEATTIRYAVITAMCEYFTDIELSKATSLCRSAINKIRNHNRSLCGVVAISEAIRITAMKAIVCGRCVKLMSQKNIRCIST